MGAQADQSHCCPQLLEDYFVVCFVVFLTNYRLERSIYVKLKTWMSNSEVPDETAHYEVGWSYKQPFKHYDAIKNLADYSG